MMREGIGRGKATLDCASRGTMPDRIQETNLARFKEKLYQVQLL